MLLTRSPLEEKRASSLFLPFDLHVLGTLPAFILSQDQTLQNKNFKGGIYDLRIDAALEAYLKINVSHGLLPDSL